MTGHIKNFTTWVTGTDFFNGLTEEQQELLVKTGNEAGLYNNELQAAAIDGYKQQMIDAGVEITDLTPEQMDAWQAAAASFYDLGDEFGWTPGLYDTVKAAMGAK